MKFLTRPRKAAAVLAIAIASLASVAIARNTYIYFEYIVNCDSGGWVVISEGENGEAIIDVLCDGG